MQKPDNGVPFHVFVLSFRIFSFHIFLSIPAAAVPTAIYPALSQTVTIPA
jgi:hypothetical protein